MLHPLPLRLGWWCREKGPLWWCRQSSLLLLLLLWLVLLLGLRVVMLQLLWLSRALGCLVPHHVASKAYANGSPAHALVAPLALWAQWVLLVVSTMLTVEGLSLLWKPLDLLSLGRVECHFIISPLPLLLQTPLILCSVLLTLVTSLCGALGQVVQVMGMLAVQCPHHCLH